MKKRFLVDANAFLRFLLNDIPFQKKAFQKLLSHAQKSEIGLIVPQIIIFEIQFALEKYYKFSKADITDKLQSLVEAHYLQIEDRTIFFEALKIYSRSNISFVDCFLYAKAKQLDVGLFTFDQDLQKLQE